MPQRRKVDKKVAAKMLYCFGGALIVDIARDLKVGRDTVARWKVREGWDELRQQGDEMVAKRVAEDLAAKRAEAVTQGISFTENVMRIVDKYALSESQRILEPESFDEAVQAGADAIRLRRELEGQGPTGNVEIVVNLGGQRFENPVPPKKADAIVEKTAEE